MMARKQVSQQCLGQGQPFRDARGNSETDQETRRIPHDNQSHRPPEPTHADGNCDTTPGNKTKFDP